MFLSCFWRSLGGLDPRRIAVCWSGVYEDQEQRSNLQRARVRLRIAGWEREEEWGQCRRVWGTLPNAFPRSEWEGKRGNGVGGVCVVIG